MLKYKQISQLLLNTDVITLDTRAYYCTLFGLTSTQLKQIQSNIILQSVFKSPNQFIPFRFTD
jgi:hypothetical protein